MTGPIPKGDNDTAGDGVIEEGNGLKN